MNQRLVDVVWEDDHLVVDVARAQQLDEAGRLREGHVPVVVSVDEQDRRLPRVDGRDGRRLVGDVLGIEHVRVEVDAGEIDARHEDVGVARERLRRQEAAVGEAPDADALRIHVVAALQVRRAGHDVLVLGVAALPGVGRVPERPAVADAAPEIHRQDDVALRGEPLIHRVHHVVGPHVVIAEQHLPDRPAVDEDHRRPALARLDVLRQEELVVDLEAVGRLRHHVDRDDVLLERELLRQRRIDDLQGAAVHRRERNRLRPARVGAEHRHLLPGGDRHRVGLDPFAARELHGGAARRRHLPDVAPLDVAHGCCSSTACGRRPRAT